MFQKILGTLVEWACLILLVLLCADVFLGVFSRYVLVRTFTWYDEIARACLVWMVFLGAAAGVRHYAHFRLTLAIARLPRRAQRVADGFGCLMVMALGGVLIQQGWVLVELGRFQSTPVIGLSKFWIYLSVPVGGALMILFALEPLWGALQGSAGGGPDAEAGTALSLGPGGR